MILINDIHISANRVSGTTPASREALRTYIFEQFSVLLRTADGHDLCILGDLFDGFSVDARDWLETYMKLAEWCANNPDSNLYLVAGNHDISSKGSRVSSFETLAAVLDQQFDNIKVVGIDQTYDSYIGKFWVIAHHRNQDLFDLTLDRVLDACKRDDFVLLHANFSNRFAEASDHSLSVSDEQAYLFNKKGVTLVFAHEHQHRVERFPHEDNERFGTVVCLGNQIPTSISDVLGGGDKYDWELTNGHLQKHVYWDHRDGGYQEHDWRNLAETPDTAQFVRVVGDATNAEAASVIDAVHKFRQRSQAFVVTNAVKIDGIAEMGDLPSNFEVAKKFDVMAFVYKQLDEAESEVIKKIVEEME